MRTIHVVLTELSEVVKHYCLPELTGFSHDNIMNTLVSIAYQSVSTYQSVDKVEYDTRGSIGMLLGSRGEQFPWLLFDLAFRPCINTLGYEIFSLIKTYKVASYHRINMPANNQIIFGFNVMNKTL